MMAGELLGPRQAALVDALTERLRNGFAPMNDNDLRVAVFLCRVLGLDDEPRERALRSGEQTVTSTTDG